MKVEFYNIGQIDEKRLKFAVISTWYDGKIVLVRHKERETWEMPGGHREKGEPIEITAKRELVEETGAMSFKIKEICEYSVEQDGEKSFGRLFISIVDEFGDLPDLEIGEVKLFNEFPENLTYKNIQPFLQEKIFKFKKKSRIY